MFRKIEVTAINFKGRFFATTAVNYVTFIIKICPYSSPYLAARGVFHSEPERD